MCLSICEDLIFICWKPSANLCFLLKTVSVDASLKRGGQSHVKCLKHGLEKHLGPVGVSQTTS